MLPGGRDIQVLFRIVPLPQHVSQLEPSIPIQIPGSVASVGSWVLAGAIRLR